MKLTPCILDENNHIVETTFEVWSQWLHTHNRFVGDTSIGVYRVSTVFMGLPRPSFFHDRPGYFETMVFENGDPVPWLTTLYSSWAEAEAGHGAMVSRVKSGNIDPQANDQPPILDAVIHAVNMMNANKATDEVMNKLKEKNNDTSKSDSD